MGNKAQYKDVEVPEQLLEVINHMPDVERYRDELHNLGNQWDLLTILGQMSGTGTDMTGTRLGFQRLTSELLGQLGMETLKKTVQEIGGKAQVAVDIVIRNLFERTADIGFLATDDDIREFLRAIAGLDTQLATVRQEGASEVQIRHLEEARRDQVARMVSRFQEYVDKYSVYFNIILLDTGGHVLAQLDASNQVLRTTDPLLGEAMTTTAEYVEAFRPSDLLPGRGDSLIYAYRVTETNESDSGALGVLCLCFRFENEMEGVFKNLRGEDDWAVITLLDRTGRVIASSDKYHVPVGAVLDMDPGAEFKVSKFAGREYLTKTCATKGYQGYKGLGWFGHVMLPMDHAFDKNGAASLRQRVTQDILDAVMSDPRLFPENLRAIPGQADQIQHELERTVWNGNVRETDGQSKVLLWNISDAGARTKMVFEQSIGNLHETVISGILNDVEFQAALAVDIMDRNLYERANDCRWWALTSAFRAILSKPEATTQDIEAMSSILVYINGLYTVYTNLFAFNSSGRILAVSDPAKARLLGTTLNADWVRETLALKDSKSYFVSPFEATPLYDNRPTYIYGAAVMDQTSMKSCVGGIGIVFDSEPQFREMLQDSLPKRNGSGVVDGSFGVFADRRGRVISSTDPGIRPGDTLDIDPSFLALPCGEGASRIIERNGHYLAVGARTSSGYREYKVEDGYANDVVGLVFVPLAEVSRKERVVRRRREVGMGVRNTRGGGQACMELATFYIGDCWLGLSALKVREAIQSKGITVVPGAYEFVVGKLLYNDHLIPVIDIRTQLKLPKADYDPNSPIIVVDAGTSNVGIIVDSLGEIPEVRLDRVDSTCSLLDCPESYIECIIKPERHGGSEELLVVLDPAKLLRALVERQPPVKPGNGSSSAIQAAEPA